MEIPFGSHHRGTDVYTTTHCNKRVVNHSVQWGWAAVHSDVRTTSIQELLYYYYLHLYTVQRSEGAIHPAVSAKQ